METRALGRTGLEVSRMGLGGLFVSRVGGEYEQARTAIHRAIELGVNYIDTAPGYLDSEEVLGRALADIDAPLIMSTKLGGRPKPFEPQNKDALRESFQTSLKLLGRDHVDILMIHEPDRQGQHAWWSDLRTFDGPVMDVLGELREEGVITFLGLGGTTTYELARIIDTGRFDVVLTAFNYSLLWREAVHEVIPAAKRQGMGVVAGSPLQQGALARRYDEQVNDLSRCQWLSKPRREQYKALYAFLDEIGMPLVEAALRFVLSNPDVDCLLNGARSAAEVENSIAAVEKGPLPPDIMARLDEIAAMVPFRPYEEPFGLPFHQDTIRAVGTGGR